MEFAVLRTLAAIIYPPRSIALVEFGGLSGETPQIVPSALCVSICHSCCLIRRKRERRRLYRTPSKCNCNAEYRDSTYNL